MDTMLALGRAILAELRTNSQNDTLMQKLTNFIQDWSDLQMVWQNWYNELHANTEKSKGLNEQLDRFEHDIGTLEPACASLFPATLSMVSLDTKLSELQVRLVHSVIHKVCCRWQLSLFVLVLGEVQS